MGPKLSAETRGFDFHHAKILAFFKIKLDDTIEFVMIAKGPRLKSSIIILDSQLEVKDTPTY